MFEMPQLVQMSDKVVKDGNFAIVDWVGNNPMNAAARIPVVVAFNLSAEDLEKVDKGEIKLPRSALGTNQRVVLQIVQSNVLEDGKLSKISSVGPREEDSTPEVKTETPK